MACPPETCMTAWNAGTDTNTHKNFSTKKKNYSLVFYRKKKSQREFLWFWLVCTAKVTTKVCMRELTLHGFSLSFTTFKHSFPCAPISIDNYSLFLGLFGFFFTNFIIL